MSTNESRRARFLSEAGGRPWCGAVAIAGLFLAGLVPGVNPAHGQLDHGIGVLISCDNVNCVGDLLDCSGPAIHIDTFLDSWQVDQAWFLLNPGMGNETRVPAAGNAPIQSIIGNAVCSDDGGACNPATGDNCALPCIVGPAGCTENGLPGAPGPGQVRFMTGNLHPIQAGDLNAMNQVPTQLFITGNDHCNGMACGGTDDPGCDTGSIPQNSSLNNPSVSDCDDGSACTTDSCDPGTGMCINDPIDCDDDDACTADSCDPATGCVHLPIDCDDDSACTADSCDPATGCVNTPIECDDGTECTADSCDPATGCVHSAVDCRDSNACTSDSCDPAIGCVAIPVNCDDGNACTDDGCDPDTGCIHDVADCDDKDACTIDSCDPSSGCDHKPVVCDDGDVCTDDVCDPATGECVFPDIEPPPPGCAGGEGCTPGYWKLIDKDPASASHECNYIVPPDTLFNMACADCPGGPVCFENAYPGKRLIDVLEAGGGGPKALGRHTVAAYLNASSEDVAYLYEACQVVTMFNDLWPCAGNACNALKGLFADQNETCCPLSNCRCNDSHESCTSDANCGSGQECGGRSAGACSGDDDDDVSAVLPASGDAVSSDGEDPLLHPQSIGGAETTSDDDSEPDDADAVDGSLAGTSAACGAFGLVGMLLLAVGLLGVRWSRRGFKHN